MATGTDERRLTAMMARLFPRLTRPNRTRASGRRLPLRRPRTPVQVPVLPAPVPEVAPPGAHEQTTAVVCYDAVTLKVSAADIAAAPLPAGSSPAVPVAIEEVDTTVPILVARASAADTTDTTPPVARRRLGLGLLVLVALLAAWGVAGYQLWVLVLR